VAYEVMPGNTADKSTRKGFLQNIQDHYDKAERIGVMELRLPRADANFQLAVRG